MLGDSHGTKRIEDGRESPLKVETGCKKNDATERESSKLLLYMQPMKQQQPQLHLHGNDGDGDGELETTISQHGLSISSPSNSDPVLLIPTHHQLLCNQESIDSNFPSLAAKPFTICAPNPSITCIPYAIFSATDATSCWNTHMQHFKHPHPKLSASYNQQSNQENEELTPNLQTEDQQHSTLTDAGGTHQQNICETNRWSQESLEDNLESKEEVRAEQNDFPYGLPARHQSAVFMSSSFSNSENFYQLLSNPMDQTSYQYLNSQVQLQNQSQQLEQQNKIINHGSSHLLTSPYPGVTPSKVLLRFPAQQPTPAFSSIIIQDPVLAPYNINAFPTPSVSSLFHNSNFKHYQPIAASKMLPKTITYENDPSKLNVPSPYPGLSNFRPEVMNLPSSSSMGSPVVAEFFPTIYVSPLGVIEVLLRNHVVVEMTLDRAIRIVNRLHKAVVATSCRGNASCIYHAAAKIYQDHTTFEVLAYGNRQARARTEYIVFGGSFSNMAAGYCVTSGGHMSLVAKPNFSDISKDMSRALLFSSNRYGADLVPECVQTVEGARYRLQRNGSITISINSVRIHQTATCDVIVTSERKNLRVSPATGLARVMTHFVDMTVEPDWTIRVKRGGHKLHASLSSFILANDLVEFGFDLQQRLFIQPIRIHKETLIFQGKPLGDRQSTSGTPDKERIFSLTPPFEGEAETNRMVNERSLSPQIQQRSVMVYSENEIRQETPTGRNIRKIEKDWKDTIEIPEYDCTE